MKKKKEDKEANSIFGHRDSDRTARAKDSRLQMGTRKNKKEDMLWSHGKEGLTTCDREGMEDVRGRVQR